VPLEDLPYVDEHRVDVAAPAGAVWDAALATFHRELSGAGWSVLARGLGCDPSLDAPIPGFRVTEEDRPRLLVLQGRHRFARYGIVIRVEPTATGARCRLESRARFPGPHGAAYRLAVIGTRLHVVAVRHLLGSIRRAAEAGAQVSPAGPRPRDRRPTP
jgi:hypothetical protein